MNLPTLSSHDLLADRRFAWASAMAADGDLAAAADLFEQVVERAPEWAPGWAGLAEARDRLNRPDALAAWHRVLALDPQDRFGAALRIGRLGESVPDSMPAAYVTALFDGYAPRFEHHLVEDLGYRGPSVVMAALDRQSATRRFLRALDLGCGTGLMGRAIRHRTERVDGVDLSSQMIERARSSGLYARLTTGGIDAALASADAGGYDLILAADVMAYVGALEPVMTGVAHALAAGGYFIVTLQSIEPAEAEAGCGIRLGADLRFAHSACYVERAVVSAGLDLLSLAAAPVRSERGCPVPGWVAVAGLSA